MQTLLNPLNLLRAGVIVALITGAAIGLGHTRPQIARSTPGASGLTQR